MCNKTFLEICNYKVAENTESVPTVNFIKLL